MLFNEFLGLDYRIEIKDTENYEIVLENSNKLIIKDHFFNKFPKDLEYLNEKNIPIKVKFAKSEFTSEGNTSIIFGDSKSKIQNY